MVIMWVMSIYSHPLLHSMKCWHVVLCCRCHYIVCRLWYTLCDMYVYQLNTSQTVNMRNIHSTQRCVQLCLCGFITSYGIPSFYSCQAGSDWMLTTCVRIIKYVFIVEYADGHCLIVLFRCNIRFVSIIFPFLVMLEPNGHCVNMTVFCIAALFYVTFLPLPPQISFTWWNKDHFSGIALLFSDVETLMFCLTEQNKVFMFRFFSINGFFYELSSSLLAVTDLRGTQSRAVWHWGPVSPMNSKHQTGVKLRWRELCGTPRSRDWWRV